MEWFQEHYPAVKPSSVTSHITAATVNSHSRHHYPGADQHLIFKRSDGSLERYDATRHGKWDRHGELIPGSISSPGEYRYEPAAGSAIVQEQCWSGDELVSRLHVFEMELRAAGLSDNTVNTYVGRSETFVRWLRGEYTPRGPNTATPEATQRPRQSEGQSLLDEFKRD